MNVFERAQAYYEGKPHLADMDTANNLIADLCSKLKAADKRLDQLESAMDCTREFLSYVLGEKHQYAYGGKLMANGRHHAKELFAHLVELGGGSIE